MSDAPLPGLVSATKILSTEWPDITWVIPDLLPVGLSFLAGAPKVGKSWLALQIAKSVASGGYLLGKQANEGRVLYLALEDSRKRLQSRMEIQCWPSGLNVDFMTLVDFQAQIRELRGDGWKKLAWYVEQGNYQLILIDTLSRAVYADQNDVREMTACLSPLQALAHANNCSVLIVDHHRKMMGDITPDAIGDILGSTAKGGVSDTIIGLYKKRTSTKAQLAITGRDVEESIIDIKMVKETGSWQLADDRFTPQMEELIAALSKMGSARNLEIAKAVGREPGAVHKHMEALEAMGKVKQSMDKVWEVVSN